MLWARGRLGVGLRLISHRWSDPHLPSTVHIDSLRSVRVNARGVLKRMRLHVEQCRGRADPAQPPECKVCKLWQALHRTRQNSGQRGEAHGQRQTSSQQASIRSVSTGQNREAPISLTAAFRAPSHALRLVCSQQATYPVITLAPTARSRLPSKKRCVKSCVNLTQPRCGMIWDC